MIPFTWMHEINTERTCSQSIGFLLETPCCSFPLWHTEDVCVCTLCVCCKIAAARFPQPRRKRRWILNGPIEPHHSTLWMSAAFAQTTTRRSSSAHQERCGIISFDSHSRHYRQRRPTRTLQCIDLRMMESERRPACAWNAQFQQQHSHLKRHVTERINLISIFQPSNCSINSAARLHPVRQFAFLIDFRAAWHTI